VDDVSDDSDSRVSRRNGRVPPSGSDGDLDIHVSLERKKERKKAISGETKERRKRMNFHLLAGRRDGEFGSPSVVVHRSSLVDD